MQTAHPWNESFTKTKNAYLVVELSQALFYIDQLAPKIVFHRDCDLVLLELDGLLFGIAIKFDAEVAGDADQLLADLIAAAQKLLFGRLRFGHILLRLYAKYSSMKTSAATLQREQRPSHS